MASGALAMSGRERERLVVIAQVWGKVVSQGAAADRLGICVRQVKRLVRAYRAEGDAGLVSRQRGRASNRRLAPGVGERASELLGGKYRDFGPTLACEKLAELEGIFARDDPTAPDSAWLMEAEAAASPAGVSIAPAAAAIWRTDPDRRQSA